MYKKKTNYIYSRLYLNEVLIALEAADIKDISIEKRKKIIFYGINTLNYNKTSKSMNENELYGHIIYIVDLIKSITFEEFINIFPINKEYDGEKYGMKDYFSTIEYLKTVDLKSEIAEEVENLLSNYYNYKVIQFCVCQMMTISTIVKNTQGRDLFSEFLEEIGVKIDRYSEIQGNDGKKFMRNTTTGEIFKIKKPMPSYLKLVK